MSNQIEPKDGGPAFIFKCRDMKVYHGISLRDYFAAHALAGLMSLPNCGEALANETVTVLEIASNCYDLADAMLKERGK